MNKQFSVFISLLVPFVLPACKSKRNIASISKGSCVSVNIQDQKEVVQYVDSAKADFVHLSYAVAADLEIKGDKKPSFDINFKMKRNDTIWASVTAILGIEIARVLITKDSITIMDKINKVYIVQDLNFFKSYLGRKVTVGELQDILLGYSIFKKEPLNYTFKPVKDTVLFNFTDIGFNIKESYDACKLRPSVISAVHKLFQQSIIIKYSSYANAENNWFPYVIDATALNSGDNFKLNLKSSEYNFAFIPAFPFRIPAGFVRESNDLEQDR